MPNSTAATTAVSGVVAVLLLDYLPQHRAWGWMKLAQGAAALGNPAGMRFAKIMGSGHGGGFSLRPSSTHQGLITLFEQADQAVDFLQGAHVEACRSRARQSWSGVMSVTSAKGEWDGCSWDATPSESLGQLQASPESIASLPLAVLTRASIRPAKALAFWRFAPAAQSDLGKAPGCQLAMGLGEAPLVRQCTFSLWKDTRSMTSYAHQGAHQLAIAAAQRGNFFSESLFVRMRLLRQDGEWSGHAGQAAQANASTGQEPHG
ncbi:MAG: hypothetical protein V4731_07905 [Pseudomonadota bacterium]